jgi:ABC-type multidrug transport system ATPase subunit
MFLMAVLFIISHIFFQLWILTFIKSGSAGRALTVVFLVFTLFFSYLHMFFTLSENNDVGSLKHVFSIIPLSAYQLFCMSAYRQELNHLEPITWSNMGENSDYSASMGLMWLAIDCVIYFLLFFVCNLCVSRPFCTSPLRWIELFSPAAWRRFMGQPAVSSEQVSSQSENFIQVKGLKKVYEGKKDVTALDGIDFTIKRGEVIVMIGPNGAGKSTLINILSGAIEPTEGKVNILGGEETTRFKELQQFLGVCFQDNVIINLLSVREHLYLFGAFRGVPEEQIDEAVEFFGSQLQLTHMLENRAGDLSGGQKRKLCIAMSLLGNPPLVIMDEPTAGVDVQARQLIWKMISSLKDTTSIITSHALEEAEAVSSRLFIASSGKLPFCGTSTELRNQYKCGYILRINSKPEDLQPIKDLVKSIIPDAAQSDERDDQVLLPVCDEVTTLLKTLEEKKEEIGLQTYAFSVEQLEDMLLKLIQTDEAKFEGK